MTKSIRKRLLRSAALAPLLASALALSGCSDDTFDTSTQIGPNPVLPAPQQYLFPPMHVASVVGWKNGEKPTVANLTASQISASRVSCHWC